jgi:hypothetical protein
MSKYAVDKVLWQIARDPAFEEVFKADAAAQLEGRDLEEGERAALLAFNIREMFQGGGHPFLIYMAAQRMRGGWSFQFMTDYVDEIKDLKLVDIRT